MHTAGAPGPVFRHAPLVHAPYIADPSARVFDGRVYVYGSHDIEGPAADDQPGRAFVMRDYQVLSMPHIGGPVTVHPPALRLEDVRWADRQLWAPDAVRHQGRFYLYFPAKDAQGIFRIGVAIGERPEGPFVADPAPIPDTYSIDPAVLADRDGAYYLYFGGIHGGQLQRWEHGSYDPRIGDTDLHRDEAAAVMPRVARLEADMRHLAEPPRPVQLLDEAGMPLRGGDHARRFFEAAWVHRHDGRYYFSYSTGDTHTIAYATGDSPYGPFTYRGVVLAPVQGWTTHHSIVAVDGRWFLFYHDTQQSGRTELRNTKVAELQHAPDGSIHTIHPFMR
ncbi:MAG: glycoside hydrolase family 43 protein [Pseudoxanthomonas sp.]